MLHLLRVATDRAVALALAVTLAGCATTEMTTQWKDPNFTGGSLRGKKVLVVCQGRDDTMRRICEDQWVTRLGAQGVPGVQSYSIPNFPPSGVANPDQMKSAAKTSGAIAIATMQLNPSSYQVVNQGAQVGIGVGGGSGGGYSGGGFSFGGLGISLPVGGGTATQGLGSSTTLVDAATNALVWSGSATTPASSDVMGQVSALTQITIETIQKSGLF
jgi:uncharacterized membrane protein YgcG